MLRGKTLSTRIHSSPITERYSLSRIYILPVVTCDGNGHALLGDEPFDIVFYHPGGGGRDGEDGAGVGGQDCVELLLNMHACIS